MGENPSGVETSAVLVEHLVIGAEALLLVVLFVNLLLPGTLENIAKLGLGEIVFFIIAVYPSGLAWSRLADIVSSPIDRRLKHKQFGGQDQYDRALVKLLVNSNPLSVSASQVRAGYRVARASSLTAVAALPLLLAYLSHPPLCGLSAATRATLVTMLVALGVVWLATWYHLRRNYLRYVKLAHDHEAA